MSDYDDEIQEFDAELHNLSRKIRELLMDSVPGLVLTEEDVVSERYTYDNGDKTITIYFSDNCPPTAFLVLNTIFDTAGLWTDHMTLDELFNDDEAEAYVEIEDDVEIIDKVMGMIDEIKVEFSQMLNEGIYDYIRTFGDDQVIVYLIGDDKNLEHAIEATRAMLEGEGIHISINKNRGIVDVSLSGKNAKAIYEELEEPIGALSIAIETEERIIAESDKPGSVISNAALVELGKVTMHEDVYNRARSYLESRGNGGSARG